MNPLKITSGMSEAAPGNFGATVDASNSRLLIPDDLATALASHGIRTATDFVSYVQTFPSAVAMELNWSVSDVLRGLENLKNQLRGHVDDAILNPPEHPKR